MKQNLRKILAVMMLAVVAMFTLTACGNTASESTVSYDEQYLHSVADFLITNWDAMGAEEITEYANMEEEDAEALISNYGLPFTAEAFTTAFAGYQGSVDELGAYVSTDSYDAPIVKGNEVTLNVNLTYEKRPAQISIVFNKKSIAQSVAVNPTYSLGEIGKKAAMNTLIGMGVVFSVLIFISILISLFKYIPVLTEKMNKKKEEPAPAAAAPAAPAPAPVEEELADDGEIVAAITAAICAYTGTSSDGFVVRSIRRSGSRR